ncbi:MAG: Gfo/Idh/MocA family oxidoreductase [Bacteroidales bacterium]|nr:Gfo/Idh/MocA family oxidoreductase [Bacteroidales bacterium]MCF8390123.1 Gfo/Idh/MocA family oxidoreductase [Bacteroidales bacterium]
MKANIRWGILSTARIGVVKVIPAIMHARFCEVTAISSRDFDKSKSIAEKLGIPKFYGSYEELINDPDIDAIYNPLPNHLHLEWTIRAIKAGKHVLCEKPIALNATEAIQLNVASKKYPRQKIMEAFMYHFHPQWIKVKAIIDSGRIGEVKTIQSFFSYYNIDPTNIRNKTEVGGGALMDIGCYCMSFPRFLLGKEPIRVLGIINRDPEMKIDRLASGILDFSEGVTSTFTCGTQLMPYQRVNILADKGHIEVEVPVNAPPDSPSRIWLRTGSEREEIVFDPVDQYSLQTEAFALAIIKNTALPYTLDDSVANMKVIEAVAESSNTNNWISI